MRGRSFQDQFHSFSCLGVLHNAVVAWNLLRVGEVVARLRAEGHDVHDAPLARDVAAAARPHQPVRALPLRPRAPAPDPRTTRPALSYFLADPLRGPQPASGAPAGPRPRLPGAVGLAFGLPPPRLAPGPAVPGFPATARGLASPFRRSAAAVRRFAATALRFPPIVLASPPRRHPPGAALPGGPSPRLRHGRRAPGAGPLPAAPRPVPPPPSGQRPPCPAGVAPASPGGPSPGHPPRLDVQVVVRVSVRVLVHLYERVRCPGPGSRWDRWACSPPGGLASPGAAPVAAPPPGSGAATSRLPGRSPIAPPPPRAPPSPYPWRPGGRTPVRAGGLSGHFTSLHTESG